MSFDLNTLISTAPALLHGICLTALITFLAFVTASIFGLLGASVSWSNARIAACCSKAYIQLARATPEMIAIFWAYYCLPILLGASLSGLTCGVLALGLIGGGYMAEIIRGGVQSVERGQWEAANSLGLPRYITWSHIIAPQAIRKMVPAILNYFTDLLKATTLLAGIGVSEVAYAAYISGSASFRYLEPLTGVAILFFLIIFPLSVWARNLNSSSHIHPKSK